MIYRVALSVALFSTSLFISPYSLAVPAFDFVNLGNLGTDASGVGNSGGSAINASGQVTGRSYLYDASGNYSGREAFIADGQGPMKSLGNLGISPSGFRFSQGEAINASGHVTGYSQSYDASGKSLGDEAFIADGQGPMKGLGNLGTPSFGVGYSRGYAINDNGQVAGESDAYDATGNFLGREAFIADGQGPMKGLGNLGTNADGRGESRGRDINASGQVTGWSDVYDASGNYSGREAFIADGQGPMKGLGVLSTDSFGSGRSSGRAINNSGQVTGNSDVYDASGEYLGQEAFIADGQGPMKGLGNLGTDANGSGFSDGWAINNNGQVTGYSGVFDSSGNYLGTQAFIADGQGPMKGLGWLGTNANGEGESFAEAMNSGGHVTGYSTAYDASGNPLGIRAFLWYEDFLYQLDQLIPNLDANIVLEAGVDINDFDQITGQGRYIDTGDRFAFLVTPRGAPAPATLVLFSLGLFSLRVVSRRCRR